MKRCVLGFGVVLVLLAGPSRGQDVEKVVGRVIDRAGNPVAGAEVASMWIAGGQRGEVDGKQTGLGSATTDADGRFTAKVSFYGPEAALMAIDVGRKVGGKVIVPVADAKKEVVIRVEPLVHVHGQFTSKDLGKTPPWVNVYIILQPGKVRLLQNSTLKAECSMMLPPGEYEFYAYGSDVTQIRKPLTLRAEEPDVDLGTMDIPATFLAQHKGKELPAWSIVDARGVKKDVTLADYRGKWVMIDFWGYWCGPCVRQLGELIDFYADHAAERDKFEILAFHDGSVKDFSEMDAKTEHVKKSLWRGRDLPFPVLLDSQKGDHGATIEAFGIRQFPTTILIDPEGKLVGEVSPQSLETKLTPIPIAVRTRRAMDRDVAFGVEAISIKEMAKFLSEEAKVPIRIDEKALEAAKVNPDVNLPLTVSASLSLRSWLELLLDPVGLEAVPGDEGIAISAQSGKKARVPSEAQERAASRLDEMLGRNITFEFKDASLAKVIGFLEEKTEETFLLDPAGRLDGTIDPEATVTGTAKDAPARQAIEGLLKPLGMTALVKDEAVVFTKQATP